MTDIPEVGALNRMKVRTFLLYEMWMPILKTGVLIGYGTVNAQNIYL